VVRIVFHGQTSKRKREDAVPQILEWLRQMSDSFKGIAQSTGGLSKVVESAIVVRGSHGLGPCFEVDVTGWLDDPALDRVNQKLGKEYVSSAPIELLVSYRRQPPLLPDKLWPELCALLEQYQGSKFRRVWVFDVKNKEILFVYPAKL